SLRFNKWQNQHDTTVQRFLLGDINQLPGHGIAPALVKRMLVNYYILRSEWQMLHADYAGKDKSLAQIHQIYGEMSWDDEEIYSLAKYYTFYAQPHWAEKIIAP